MGRTDQPQQKTPDQPFLHVPALTRADPAVQFDCAGIVRATETKEKIGVKFFAGQQRDVERVQTDENAIRHPPHARAVRNAYRDAALSS